MPEGVLDPKNRIFWLLCGFNRLDSPEPINTAPERKVLQIYIACVRSLGLSRCASCTATFTKQIYFNQLATQLSVGVSKKPRARAWPGPGNPGKTRVRARARVAVDEPCSGPARARNSAQIGHWGFEWPGRAGPGRPKRSQT
uniref:Uncharacterized protein n=1 Tax=Asparagus officinalis TaxID=4686 RepID=Q2XNV2_ASPOF|nr:hypothetical protein 12.t00034 [Asparagus officinalis]